MGNCFTITRLVSASALCLCLAAAPIAAQSTDTLVPQMSTQSIVDGNGSGDYSHLLIPGLTIAMILLLLSGASSDGPTKIICGTATLGNC